MKRQFVVTLEMPEGVTAAGMADYIANAVGFERGRRNPEDPLFRLDAGSVRVKSVPKKPRKVAAERAAARLMTERKPLW